MHRWIVMVALLSVASQSSHAASQVQLNHVLDRYAANQDGLISWRIVFTSSQRSTRSTKPETIESRYGISNMRCDGDRVFWQWCRWGGIEGSDHFVPRDRATYLSLLWDGEVYSNYRAMGSNKKGVIVFDANPSPGEIDSLRYRHRLAPLMGYCLNITKRVDEVLRETQSASLRDATETINGEECLVVDAKTKYGDYSVWFDPGHGYSIAKIDITLSKAEGHLYQGHPVQTSDLRLTVGIQRFANFNGIWSPMQGTWVFQYDDPKRGRLTTMTQVEVTQLALNPDHDALGSFSRDDVGDGTWGWITPNDQIKCVWRQGEFSAMYDEGIIAEIDRELTRILPDTHDNSSGPPDLTGSPSSEQEIEDEVIRAENIRNTLSRKDLPLDEEEITKVKKSKATHPHCGLYCIYAMLRMADRQVDFPDLVKAQYLGSAKGSAMLELRKAALDYGLHAEPITRLTTRGLRHCIYGAILHVRLDETSPEYNHYELFLGMKDGKARLYNPPQPPRLVTFAELAPRWDGRLLLLSKKPVDVSLVTEADSQLWLLYAFIGALGVLVVHLGRRLWLSAVGQLPRQWLMYLSAGQVVVLGLMALLWGGLYHFAGSEGLLANAIATQSLQKAHAVDFLRKVSERNVSGLLGTETIFIDARLRRDYEVGHLDGAINLPIDANDVIWKEVTASIPKDAHIVTYCQSAGCKFAETTALRLTEIGYLDVAMFKGGWLEWTAKHGQPKTHKKGVDSEDAARDNRT